MMRQLLFRMAKGPLMGRMVGYAFQYGSWAIPVKRVPGSRDIIAFHHPQPSYEHHLILSPKRAIGTLHQMASESLSRYFGRVWEAAEAIRAAHPEYHDGYILVANGGKRQEVQQVHFHMFTGHDMVHDHAAQAASVYCRERACCVLKPADPDWEIHFVIKPTGTDRDAYFRSVLQSIALLDTRFHIVQRGYSLVCQRGALASDAEWPVFHIVSGKRLT